MVLPSPNHDNNNNVHISVPDLLHSFKNGGNLNFHDYNIDDFDSNCSTPYVSAPSSPGRSGVFGGGGPSGYFFSAPTSPMHCMFSSCSTPVTSSSSQASSSVPGSFEFEFSSRFSSEASVGSGSMISADELFFNGQIRPMKLSSHLQRPQTLAPLLDLEVEDEDECGNDRKCEESVTRGRDLNLRNRSVHRKTRSMSPLRNSQLRWPDDDCFEDSDVATKHVLEVNDAVENEKQIDAQSTVTTPSVSASSSRSSSSGRNSKKWIFLKEFLYKSKSEGSGGKEKDKFWSSISFTPAKDKSTTTPSSTKQKRNTQSSSSSKSSFGSKPLNGVAKRRTVPPPSPHELHYTANRAQAEELKKKTYLPYRQGLFGCLGFSSKGYGALNGFARTLNPVSSR